MLAVTRRPSATTPGSVANLPSSSTSCATERVAAAPEPIATPMSASLSASASFTPSPVIATTWPRDCSAPTIARFCCGRDPPEDRVRLEHLGEPVLVVGQLAGVERLAGVEPDPPGDRADRARVVARDHLELRRPARGSRRASRPRRVAPAPRTAPARPRRGPAGSVSPSSGASDRASSSVRLPGRGELVGHAPHRAPRVGPHHLRRADHPAPLVAERRRAPLAGRRERDRAGAASSPGSANAAAIASSVPLRLSSAAERAERGRGLVLGVTPERLDAVEHDRALGERAGLVEAHDVDARQALDRGQLLHQHLAPGEDDRGDAERDRREEHEALGHHADDAGDRAGDRRRHVAVLELAPEQERADHEDQPGDVAQDQVDAVDELGPRHREPAGLLRDLAGVRVGARPRSPASGPRRRRRSCPRARGRPGAWRSGRPRR